MPPTAKKKPTLYTTTTQTFAPPPNKAPAPFVGPGITYNGVTAPGGTTATSTTPGTPTPDQSGAFADLQNILQQYGLSSLSQWAWGEITAGKTEAEILLDLQQQPEYQQAFPGIGLRQKNGLPAISPGDYLNYVDSATQIFNAAGMGQYLNAGLIGEFIGGDMSLNELQTRVGEAQQAVYQMPQAVRDAFQRDYGISGGDLAYHFLDPTIAAPILQQQFAAAQIGGAGILSGYKTDVGVDTRLAADGLSMQQAEAGFADLGEKSQLFNALPGEAGGTTISQDQQLGAEFEGNAAAQATITRVQRQRLAQFEGGGGFATNSQGFAGLGVAQ